MPNESAQSRPVSGTREGVTAAVLLVLAFAAQWAIHDRAIVPMDEGHLAAAASWMLHGKLLYREIHTGIFPGIYLLTSGLFALFGEDLIVTRWAAVVMNCVITLILWRLARRMLAPHWALLAPLLHVGLVVVSFPVLSMFNYSTLAVCFGLLGLLFLLRYLDSGSITDGLLLGLAIACSALTKQNFGGLVFIALGAALLWCRPGSALGGRPLWRTLAPIGASGASLTLLVVLYFASSGTLPDLLDATILSLGGSQLQDFNNPLPPILGPHPEGDGRFLFLYLPPSVFSHLIRGEPLLGIPIDPWVRSLAIRLSYGIPILALLIAPIVAWRTRCPGDDAGWRATRAIVLFGIVFSPGIFPSAIWSHLAFVLIPILLLFALIADRIEEMLGRVSAQPAQWVALWRGLAVITLALGFGAAMKISADITRWNPVPLALERGSLRVSERDAGLLQGAHRFVAECAPPGEPIFAAPDIPVVYFLSDRLSPSPYDLTIPGNVDGPLIARRLEETRTGCIVFNPQMYPEFPPFARLFPVLARYIETHYTGRQVIEGGDSKWVGMARRQR